MKDAVGIHLESYLYLRDTHWLWRDVNQFKPPQGFIILGHLPFTLHDMYGNHCLVIFNSGEYLAPFHRYCSIPRYQSCKYPPFGFKAGRDGHDIKEYYIFYLAL